MSLSKEGLERLMRSIRAFNTGLEREENWIPEEEWYRRNASDSNGKDSKDQTEPSKEQVPPLLDIKKQK